MFSAIKETQLVAENGGLTCIFHCLLDGPPGMIHAIVMTITFLVDSASTRKFIQPAVDVEVVYLSSVHSHHTSR